MLLLLLMQRLMRLLLRLGRIVVVPGIVALRPGGVGRKDGRSSTASFLHHGCMIAPRWLLSYPRGVHPVRIFWSLRTHSIGSSGTSPSQPRCLPEYMGVVLFDCSVENISSSGRLVCMDIHSPKVLRNVYIYI